MMMETELLLGLGSALWLGILTSISPCPLATNIVAISYISSRVGSSRQVFLSGLLYTMGRALTYSVLGIFLVSSIMSAPYMSHMLQKNMNKILGPLLILAGMFLLELIQLNIETSGINEKMQKRVEIWGIWGASLLGIIFALSFCPFSAALFFGSLIPLAIKFNSSVLMSSFFGIGTGLPVFAFAVLIALGAQSIGKVFNIITQVEWWARRITGAIFIIVGIYFSLVYIFCVNV